MLQLTNGQIMEELDLLNQTSDMLGVKLEWTKTVGTVGRSCQSDMFTATGTNSNAYSWSYSGEAMPDDPTKIKISVVKTHL
jgi:hypothetical protein